MINPGIAIRDRDAVAELDAHFARNALCRLADDRILARDETA
jgi:hypothetical protein